MGWLNKFLVYSVQCFLTCVAICVKFETNMMNKEIINNLITKLTAAKLSLDNLPENCNYNSIDSLKSIAKTNTDLRFLQRNIRGLIGKQDQIKNLFNKSIIPDAVMACETWLKSSTINKVNLPNLKGYHRTRSNGIGGGVSILVNSELRSREHKDMIIQTQLLEYIVVELKCDKRNILLVSCYRPPNTNVEQFIKEYKSMIKMLRAQREHEVVIGLDHNLDLLKYHLSSPTHKFLDLNLDVDLLPSITMPTRVTMNSATLIDNLFISRKLQNNYESHIILDDLSDHLACLTIIKDQNKSKKGKEIKTCQLKTSHV